MTLATAMVADTPWQIVAAAPTAELLAPLHAGRWWPWILWAVLALFGLLATGLLEGLGRARLRALDVASTDVLTGLPNRRGMQDVLARAAALSTRHGLPLAAMIIDIDRFKAVNDIYGHEVGDRVIRQVGVALANAARGEDVAGRWGGEEFLVVMHVDRVGALDAAERFRVAIESAVDRDAGTVTASIGVAAVHGGDVARLLHAADAAMYVAKEAGRNRVELSPLSAGDMSEPSLDDRSLIRPT
ncbi:MAG: GGDEF domain-containing protein [Egibacteraceae bacterium]